MAQGIHYKSYALKRGQFMSQATKESRLEKVKLLLNKLKNPADEKNFSQDQKVNK
jgi:hypothetical protein